MLDDRSFPLDIQKTMEFLLAQRANFQAQLQAQQVLQVQRAAQQAAQLAEFRAENREIMARVWNAIETLAEKQMKLDDTILVLTEAQIDVAARFRETDQQI